MIKERIPYKFHFGKTLKAIGMFAVMASCFVGCKNADGSVSVPEDATPLYTQAYPLSSEQQVRDRLLEIYEDESKMYMLRDEYLVRFPCPTEQEKIMVNFEFTPTREQKLIFEDCINEFNEIFDVINPNYKFEINYSPTQKDLLNPYAIDVNLYLPENTSSTVAAHAYVPDWDRFSEIDGSETYQSYLEIREDKLPNMSTSELCNIFKHEFMHCLGAGDAYENLNATTDTIMQRVSKDRQYLQNIDIAFLDALYRSPDNQHSEEFINDFISNYETSTMDKPEELQTEIELLKQTIWAEGAEYLLSAIEQMDKTKLIENIKTLGYEEDIINDLISKLSKNPTFNRSFGSTKVSFGELPLEKRDISRQLNYKTYKNPDILGEKYADYFGSCGITEMDYNAGFSYKTSMSISNDGSGVIEPFFTPKFYVNFDKYVIAFNPRNNLDWLDITKDNIEVMPTEIYMLTDLEPKQYFNVVFKAPESFIASNELTK